MVALTGIEPVIISRHIARRVSRPAQYDGADAFQWNPHLTSAADSNSMAHSSRIAGGVISSRNAGLGFSPSRFTGDQLMFSFVDGRKMFCRFSISVLDWDSWGYLERGYPGDELAPKTNSHPNASGSL
jgi:hypothetical protein